MQAAALMQNLLVEVCLCRQVALCWRARNLELQRMARPPQSMLRNRKAWHLLHLSRADSLGNQVTSCKLFLAPAMQLHAGRSTWVRSHYVGQVMLGLPAAISGYRCG